MSAMLFDAAFGATVGRAGIITLSRVWGANKRTPIDSIGEFASKAAQLVFGAVCLRSGRKQEFGLEFFRTPIKTGIRHETVYRSAASNAVLLGTLRHLTETYMSLWNRSVHAAYPPAARSRRRRLSMIGRAATFAASSRRARQLNDGGMVTGSGSIVEWILHRAHYSAETDGNVAMGNGCAFDVVDNGEEGRDPSLRFPEAGESVELREIRQLLAGPQPITWVFTGDTSAGIDHVAGERSCSEQFGTRVRAELARPRDAVIDTGIARTRLYDLLQDLGWRSTRFRPDVVCLMIGPSDARGGPGGRMEFRESLLQLIDRIRQDAGRVLLNTPPPVGENLAEFSDLPTYTDIVRYVADDAAVPLIDHWSHWQQLQADGYQPSCCEHGELAGLILSELGIL
jgi:lysophospholipase L1-like esterase